MQEGEPGDAMYVIKTGKLEVYVGGSLTRHVGRGCAVGELALLYHTPRSASVKVRNLHYRPAHQQHAEDIRALVLHFSVLIHTTWYASAARQHPVSADQPLCVSSLVSNWF